MSQYLEADVKGHNVWNSQDKIVTEISQEKIYSHRNHQAAGISVQFSPSVMSDISQPHRLQHARQLPELAQTRVHQVSDAIQPSHHLLSASPPAFNLSQYQGLFQWIISLYQVAKVLELQHQSFQWIFRTNFL